MTFKETKLKGAFIIQLDLLNDARGFFARSYCQKEFKKQGIDFKVVQSNLSFNKQRGTLRGMHYQLPPYAEAKTVTCLRGSIFDVIADLRRGSATYGKWLSVKLNDENCRILYVPAGFAHGFQALEDGALVSYQMGKVYHPESARGIRWDDQFFNIKWPIKKVILSDRDRAYKNFSP